MHASALFVVFSCLASALALTITSPASGTTIEPSSPLTITWTSVSSDPTSFEIEVIDPTQKNSKVLAASVSTSSGSTTINGGWSLGYNWTINAISLPTTGNTGGGILAQSGQFNVTSTGTASGATSGVTSGVTPTTMSGMTTATSATVATITTASGTDATGTSTGAASATNLNPTAASGALGVFQVSGTLMAFVALAHAFML